MGLANVSKSSRDRMQSLRGLGLPSLKGLFDVDGVFSHPLRGSALPDKEVVNRWVELIRQGVESSLATGRPGNWITQQAGVLGMAEQILNRADERHLVTNLKKLPHFAENGSVVVRGDADGYREEVVATKYKFSDTFARLAREIVKNCRIEHFAGFDEAKKCVVTIFVNQEGFGQNDLEPHKPKIQAAFKNYVSANQLLWTVVSTAIAGDAYHKDVSKELAVNGFLNDLKIPGNQPDLAVVAVGDSSSDYELFTGLQKACEDGRLPKSTELTFVFTGTEKGLESLFKQYPAAASNKNIIFAGVLAGGDEVEVYSDATKTFFDRLLA